MMCSPRHRFPFIVVVLFLSQIVCAQAGTFKNPILIDTAFDPIGVATSDFNHDGKLDVVYIDGVANPVLHVLLGNGDGTFTHGQDVTLPAGVCGYANCVINVADVTNDGNVDIILGGHGTSVSIVVMPGNGDGTFQAAIISTITDGSGNYPSFNTQMGIGDINGDGALDLVIPSSPALYVLLGDKTGKFTLGSHPTAYYTGQAIAYLHDLNGDGKLDVVVIDRIGGNADVSLGNGDGTFQAQVSYPYRPLLLADMDGDGHPDLVCVQYGQGVMVAKGNSDGTFGAPSVIANLPPNSSLATVGDYNGDGIPDFVFLTPVGVAVEASQGTLSYGAPVPSVAGPLSTPFLVLAELAPGDLNNDGHNDLVMGVDGGVLILLGNGNGSFASADSYDVGQTVGAATVADVNGDKVPDIAVTVAATYPRLLLGSGSGTFSLAPDQNQSYTSQTPTSSVFSADFNGDGKPDLLETSSSGPYGQSSVLFNVGNDTFSSPFGINAAGALTADLNGDGRGDVVYISGQTITAMLGQTNSTFATVTTPLRYAAYGIAAVGDLNKDGKPDLLTFESSSLRVWLGNGDGSFTPSGLLNLDGQQAISPAAVVIKDLDGDGNADVVITPAPNPAAPLGPLLILYGNGDGTFQLPYKIPVSHRYGLAAAADVNRDNKPDLVLTDGSGIAVMTNLGNKIFSAEDHYVAGQNISQLSVVDVNGDGFPDIVAANSGGTTVAVLLNQPNRQPPDGAPSPGTFSIAPTPSNYSQPLTLNLVMSAPPGAATATPTGSVAFYVDGNVIAEVSLIAGVASYVYATALPPATHTFIAAYSGDGVYSAESFSVLQTVDPPVYATNTILSATPPSVQASQTVRLTANVTGAVAVSSGWVTFMDGTNSLGAEPVNTAGVALLDTATLSAGTHQVSAVYQGSQNVGSLHATYQPSTSSAVVVTVNALPTATAISTPNLSPTTGTVVTFTATVTSGSITPFGGANFYDGGVLLGTTSLTAGGTTAFSTAALTTGSHNITASFNANAGFAPSTSPSLNVTVAASSSSLAHDFVLMSLRSNPQGNTVLSAKVLTGKGFPTGSVTFLDSGSLLGGAVSDGSGNVALAASSLQPGIHNLSASFSGNSQFAPAVSPNFVEQWPVSGPGFSIEPSSQSITVGESRSESLTLSVTAIGDFQQSVQFACDTGMPAQYLCTFSPSSINGSGKSYLTLQSVTTSIGGRREVLVPLGIALGFFAIFFTRRRDRHLLWALLLSFVLSVTLNGCGNPPRHGGQPQLQILSIRATSGSGANLIVHSAQTIVKLLPANGS